MKRIVLYLSLGLLFLAGTRVSAQVFDLSTGIVNGSNPPAMQALLSYDDTWTVKEPGSPTFQPVPCGSGNLDGYGYSYTGHNPNVRWLSPYLSPIGEHTSAAPDGYYYYRMEFELPQICSVSSTASAMVRFSHIGGDNLIDQLIVNGGTPFPMSHAFGPTWGPDSMDIAGYLVSGVNEIQLRLNNYGSFMGIELEGNLTISGFTYLDPSFCVSVNGSTVTASPNSPGNHTWEVYSSPTGNPGTYTYLNTYYTESLNFNIPGSGPCYYIKHKYEGECGSACSAQTVCSVSCEMPPHGQCDLTPPTNLQFDASSNKFSWDPVPGAVSYIIELFPWDPACCRTTIGDIMQYYPPLTIPVGGTSYILNPHDFGTRFLPWCFSWRVKAVCENGATTVSETKCAQLYEIGWGDKSATLGTAATDPSRASVDVFPNPTQDMVDFVIQTSHEVSFNIFVYDIGGRLVKTFGEQNTSANKAVVRWDAESLGAGVYMIVVTTSDKQTITKKLVVE